MKKTITKTKKMKPRAKIKAKVKIKARKKPKLYTLHLSLNGAQHILKSDTIIGCVELMKKPLAYKTKAILVLKSGKLTASAVMQPAQVRRLLINKMTKIIFEKRMFSILK